MHERPLSDRKSHQPDGLCWEVRAWAEPPARMPDEKGWRTLAWSATHDDAVVLAHAVTAGPGNAYEFAEVWGPSSSTAGPGRSHTCERFPEPDPDERREMWIRAASAHYTDGMDLPKRTTV